jgi:hypothetical protein
LLDRDLTVRQSVLMLQGTLVVSVLAAVALAWVLR